MRLPWYIFLIGGSLLPYIFKLSMAIRNKENFYLNYFIEKNKVWYYGINIIFDIVFAFIAFGLVYEFKIPEGLSCYSILCIGINGRGIFNKFISEKTTNENIES